MSLRNLEKIFQPRSVTVVGASSRPGTVGRTVLENLVAAGAVVYPVNPKHTTVAGIAAYPSVDALPDTPDLAVICTPAVTVPSVMRACGEKGIRGLIVISAGFRETGAAGRELEAEVSRELARFAGMRVVGPNCLGAIVPGSSLNASFAASMPETGRIAFASQSGALCTSVLDWAAQEGIGFSHFVSVGNMLDVDFGDLIDYFSQDAGTQAIILYIESITSARKFMSAARAFAATKPIVALKAGRFSESATAAASHTGAMAGEDAVYDAAFRRAGVERAHDIGEIFDCAELLARSRRPRGPRLAIVTNAGGPGVLAVDALLERGGVLARLATETIARLDELLPPAWPHGNPVDVLGDAPADRYAGAMEVVLADDGVDAVLAILSPQAMTDPAAVAEAVGQVARRTTKPILASWMGGRQVQPGIERLNQAGLPTYPTPDRALQAFMHLVSYARNLEVLHETPHDLPVDFSLDRTRSEAAIAAVYHRHSEALLSEVDAKDLLDAYGIRVVHAAIARSAEDAVAAAEQCGYPVVLKILSPQITHKSDVGGVVLNLVTPDEVRAAWNRITRTARETRSDAQIDGVSVQPMLSDPAGLELILGAKQDPTFGAVILAGMGGVAAELARDRALELPPLDERLARRMLQSLRYWRLLEGYRGKPGVALDALVETMVRFSYLVSDHPEITELDINPLLATPREAVALDARAVIDRARLDNPPAPYAHLAIRPYPHQYARRARLEDGTDILLRPIRPADEPLWHRLLADCTPDSIHARFGHLFKASTHEMATRYCFIDYDRELAIVAETGEQEARRLIGVARLVADADHQRAEYAVLVADPWQGRGLGQMLTKFCLEVAAAWNIQKVFATTDSTNTRMLATFREHGFQIELDAESGVAHASKVLNA